MIGGARASSKLKLIKKRAFGIWRSRDSRLQVLYLCMYVVFAPCFFLLHDETINGYIYLVCVSGKISGLWFSRIRHIFKPELAVSDGYTYSNTIQNTTRSN